MTADAPRRRWVLPTAWLATVLVAALVGAWAGSQATQPPRVETETVRRVTATVEQGTVALEQPYGIQANWPATAMGGQAAAGTLTSLNLDSTVTTVSAGDVLYAIDLAPTVALQGTTPAFRDLSTGMRGPDVRQLEEYLKASGRLPAADDRYTDATARAVRSWERDLGVEGTGTVPAGRVVFLPTLPAQVRAAPDVRVGMRVEAGGTVLLGASAGPTFSLRVLPERVTEVTPGLAVTIDAEGARWQAEVDHLAQSTDDPPVTVAILRPPPGQDSICGDACASALSLGETLTLPGRLILVPPTEGARVPTAAIRSDALGRTCVQAEDGTSRRVTVRAAAGGSSIVDGLTIGERVVVTGAEGEVTC